MITKYRDFLVGVNFSFGSPGGVGHAHAGEAA